MRNRSSVGGIALVFIGVLGAAAIIYQLSSGGGQKNVAVTANTGKSVVGDLFKTAS